MKYNKVVSTEGLRISPLGSSTVSKGEKCAKLESLSMCWYPTQQAQQRRPQAHFPPQIPILLTGEKAMPAKHTASPNR
jgi:hypothetical protein